MEFSLQENLEEMFTLDRSRADIELAWYEHGLNKIRNSIDDVICKEETAK